MLTKNSYRIGKNFSNILRLCHCTAGDQIHLKKLHVIKTLDKVVDPFSKIHIETPMHVKIQPLDLHEYPNGDKLILSLLSHSDEKPSEFSIKQSVKRVDIIGSKVAPNTEDVCFIQAPIRASFDIQGTGISSISIDNMHSDECSLKTVNGSVTLKDIRSNNIQVRSEKGLVSCEGTIQADKIDIRTNSDIFCKHIRSNDLKIKTTEGNISTESCYSDESHFSTVIGNMVLRNVHRNCLVEILSHGDLSMIGFDGTLKAIIKSGNASMQASRLLDKNSIFIHEAGVVDIRVPESFTELCLIEIIASKLNLEDRIIKYGKLIEDSLQKKFRYGEDKLSDNINELLVDCRNGTVEVKVSSWQEMLREQGIHFQNT